MDIFSILSLMCWTLQGLLIQETIADCSAEELSIPDAVTQSPRVGIHYAVIPNSAYFIPSVAASATASGTASLDGPQGQCPSGSSLTYIKSQEEWEDWKSIRGMYKTNV